MNKKYTDPILFYLQKSYYKITQSFPSKIHSERSKQSFLLLLQCHSANNHLLRTFLGHGVLTTLEIRYIDLSRYNFENCPLPCFFSYNCLIWPSSQMACPSSCKRQNNEGDNFQNRGGKEQCILHLVWS